jgi:hypothetical protein
MQPAAASDRSGVVLMMKGSNGGEAEVNSKEFWRKDVEDVPVDQVRLDRPLHPCLPLLCCDRYGERSLC